MYEACVSEKIRHEMSDSLQYPVYEASSTGLPTSYGHHLMTIALYN